MKPRDHQRQVLEGLSSFLGALSPPPARGARPSGPERPAARGGSPVAAADVARAWLPPGGRPFRMLVGADGGWIPELDVRIPVGGGKAFLACHALNMIHGWYAKEAAGSDANLVVWVVPSVAAARRRAAQLDDKSHHYNRILKAGTGNRLVVKEGMAPLSASELEGRTAVLVLTLPHAGCRGMHDNWLFRDSRKYKGFFPRSDDPLRHRALAAAVPGLDVLTDGGGSLVTRSLANLLRLRRPVVIVDGEPGQGGEAAGDLIAGLNPRFILRLSPRPPAHANVLATVGDRQLRDGGMIKRHVCLRNRRALGWRALVDVVVRRQVELERLAGRLGAEHDRHVRPVVVLQAERTGKPRHGARHVHVTEVRDYLVDHCGIPGGQVAVKSSTADGITGVDLGAAGCPVRFIVTRQAIPRDWHCPSIYILAVLTNRSSKLAVSPLVAQMLRQPDAESCPAGFEALNECHVYANRAHRSEVHGKVRAQMVRCGLSESVPVLVDDGLDGPAPRAAPLRPANRRFAGRLYLPQFVAREAAGMRPLDYDNDIMEKVRHGPMGYPPGIRLRSDAAADEDLVIDTAGMATRADPARHAAAPVNTKDIEAAVAGGMATRWETRCLVRDFLADLGARHGPAELAASQAQIMQDLKGHVEAVREAQAERFFKAEVAAGRIVLALFDGGVEAKVPDVVDVDSVLRWDGTEPVMKSLHEAVDAGGTNGLELQIARTLDVWGLVEWWHRNWWRGEGRYALQGWLRGKFCPDLVFCVAVAGPGGVRRRIHILEAKGDQLAGSGDTAYKAALLRYCQDLADAAGPPRLEAMAGLADLGITYSFGMVYASGWEGALDAMVKAR